MGEKDKAEKILEAYNDVFADIVNVLLFDGEEVVKEEDLVDAAPRSAYKSDGKVRDIERDVVKRWKKQNIRIACIGLENQTGEDRDMPLRVIGYDGAEYRAELDVSERYPVITLVLYFGHKKHWTAPRCLTECFDVPERLRQYVSDYRINVMEIAYLTPETVKKFKSDFGIVADYFVQMRINNDYKASTTVMKHVREILQLLAVLTKDHRFEDVANGHREGVVVTMCEFLDRVIGEGEARGRSEGRFMSAVKTVKRYVRRSLPLTKEALADIADDNDLPIEKVLEIARREGAVLH